MVAKKSFYSLLTDAVNDIAENGFTNERLRKWSLILRISINESNKEKTINFQKILLSKFNQSTNINNLLKIHKGVPRYQLEMIKPHLRIELDRRIMASANLIKLNREKSIELTMQRFDGWATSIPQTGSSIVDKIQVKSNVMKSLDQLDYEERRVANDQGHKMIDAINEVIAIQTDAIAAVWHSHFRQAGYDYREDHKERDEEVYAIAGNWALKQGLMKSGKAGYTNQITRPGEEINCRCYYVYITSLRELPEDMLTAKGKKYLESKK